MRASTLAVLAGTSLVVSACFDAADDCNDTLTCTPPQPQGGVCDGTCLPKVKLHWSDPLVVWLGDTADDPPMCPIQAASDYFDGVAAPAAPACGECSCRAPTGTCTFPMTAAVSTATCANAGTGTVTPFDAPGSWDGSCTTNDAVAGGVQSVTVGPLVLSESDCVPGTPVLPRRKMPEPPPTTALVCWGNTTGVCPSSGDVCVPTVPPPPANGWTYCVTLDEVPAATCPPVPTTACPDGYPNRYIFGDSYTDTRACAPCTCGVPEGSACSSEVSVYADGACSDPVGSVMATSSAPACADLSTSSPLGSKTGTQPVYQPGTCPAIGGPTGDVCYDELTVFCCLQ
jgi:hypothetical protein